MSLYTLWRNIAGAIAVLVIGFAVWFSEESLRCDRKQAQFQSRLEKLSALINTGLPGGTDKEAALEFLDRNHIQHTPYLVQRHKRIGLHDEAGIVGWVIDDTGCASFACNSKVRIGIELTFDDNGRLTRQVVQPSYTCL